MKSHTHKNNKNPTPVTIVKKPGRKSGYGKVQKIPFKNHVIVKMKYAAFINITSVLGAYGEAAYRLNSIFDPDYTGGGHQPYSRDIYAQLYNKYRVLKLDWRIRAQTTDQAISVLTVLPNNNQLSTIGNGELAIESTYGKFKVMSGPGSDAQYLSGSIDLASFTGRTKAQYSADDVYEALMTSDPSEQMVLHVGIAGTTGVTTRLQGVLELIYTVEMFDPLQLAQA